MGALVQPTHMVGSGFPDLLICYHGTLALIEIKDGEKAKSRRKLTQFEVDWQEEWKEAPIYIVEGDEDVMRVVRKLHGSGDDTQGTDRGNALADAAAV